jgi:zinc transporter 1/2/3
MPWLLCAAYGLTTPNAIAVGLGLRTVYDNSSFTANVVNGIFDSISAGILLYTGFVEMIARDFLFNPDRTNDKTRLSFMVVCLFLGAGIMALLGKWA